MLSPVNTHDIQNNAVYNACQRAIYYNRPGYRKHFSAQPQNIALAFVLDGR